ncbi:valine--tRNA ligase [Candidatus Woesearchaeota archaeon]|nr:valine--tRNA ligase [Candidatus Woesearchaeota archaeon]
MELPQRYDPKEAEPRWQRYWEKEQIYKFDPDDAEREIYSIDTPPPTVSGKMHLGHAFSFSQMDFVARYKRMKGYNLFYPFGTDDNGLATDRLVEKLKKVNSKKMDRNEYIKLCLDTLNEIRPGFVQDWKNVGISSDYSIFYSSINDHCRKISQKSFIELYKKGRIYRNYAPIIFCPQCRTAIAQVEMEDKKSKSTLNYIKAKMGDSYIIYSTTRPELIYGCVGMSIDEKGHYVKIDVNGEKWITSKDSLEKFKDYKYKILQKLQGVDLIGKEVVIPISGNKVKISHDELTETQYGTGVVYYCTYGGMDCIEWMTRHPGTKQINVMGLDGRYNELSGRYEGMTSEEARKKVLEDLEKEGYLLWKQPIEHIVNVHERCGTDIEYVATEQWFIKVLDLKEKLLDLGNEMNWHPKHMKNRYDNWALGLKWDWCISRQRHYGVPFPVWYDKKTGEPILADESQLPVDPLKDLPKGYKKSDVIPEKDVLDTWATSSMTPHLAIDLFKGKPIYKRLFPMNLRPQAHDIITFWLFNTVIKSHLHHNSIPWKDIMISGWALDPHGKKMSKSKGNVIAPQVMIEKYSADALRFWAGGSKLGDDLPFQEKDLVTGKKTITKLWNASKFALMHLEDFEFRKQDLETMDLWLLTKLQKLIKSCTESFEDYEYSKAKQETEIFFWNIFCDNYLEIVKDRLYNPDAYHKGARSSAQMGLYEGILNTLKLFAPIMPYITEEIYHLYFSEKEESKSIHISTWPQYNDCYVDESAEKAGDLVVEIIGAVRKFKSEKALSLKTELKQLVIDCKESDRKLLGSVLSDLKSTVRAQDIEFGKGNIVITESLKLGITL